MISEIASEIIPRTIRSESCFRYFHKIPEKSESEIFSENCIRKI